MAAGSLDASLAAVAPNQRLAELRRRMAAVPGRVGADVAATVPAHDLLPVPGPLGELLPHGGLVRGTVVACPRGAVLSSFLAAATRAGGHAAFVGQRFDRLRPSLLDVWELGGRLDRVALVDVTHGHPAEIVSVLCDGIPLVVWAPDRMRLTPREVEILRARARANRAVLVLTSGISAREPQLRIDYRRVGETGIGRGRGRLARLELDVVVRAKGQQTRSGRIVLIGDDDGRTRWVRGESETSVAGPRLARTG